MRWCARRAGGADGGFDTFRDRQDNTVIMRKPISTLGLFAAAAAVALAVHGTAPAAAGSARIAVNEPNFNFGKVPNDRAVEHVYKVENKGTKPLVVTRVQTSCGCTAAMMESSVIAPGKSGNLRVSFNPRGGKGAVTRSVTVYSNDPDKPTLQLQIIADPVPPGDEKVAEPPVKRTHEARDRLEWRGSCAKCHAPRKRGETGRKLYLSVCASCHGKNGDGVMLGKEKVGPPLRGGVTSVRTREGMRDVIRGGTGNPRMPGFDSEFDGPLTSQQIDSLVNYILKDFKAK